MLLVLFTVEIFCLLQQKSLNIWNVHFRTPIKKYISRNFWCLSNHLTGILYVNPQSTPFDKISRGKIRDDGGHFSKLQCCPLSTLFLGVIQGINIFLIQHFLARFNSEFHESQFFFSQGSGDTVVANFSIFFNPDVRDMSQSDVQTLFTSNLATVNNQEVLEPRFVLNNIKAGQYVSSAKKLIGLTLYSGELTDEINLLYIIIASYNVDSADQQPKKPKLDYENN